MSFKTFIPKIPIAVGVVTGGMTWLAVVFFLVTGMFGKPGKQAEFYQQQPEPNIPLYIDGVKTITPGAKTPLNIVINPMGQQVLGLEVKLKLKYNPIAIDTQGRQVDNSQLWNIDFGQTSISGWNYVIKKIEGDLITISAAASSPDKAIKTTSNLATLNFSLNQPGNVIFEFIQDDSNYGSTKETSVVISKDSVVSNLISQKLPSFAMEVLAPQIKNCSGVNLPKNQIEVLENANATEKQVADPQNQVIVFRLDANPSTGYSWTFDYDKNVFEQLCQDYVQAVYDCPQGADCNVPVGNGGQSLTYFKINNFIGKATIVASYARSWENQSPAKVVKVDFVLVPSIPKPSFMPSPVPSPTPTSTPIPNKVTINVTGLGNLKNLPFTLYGLPLLMTDQYVPENIKPEFIVSSIYFSPSATLQIDLEKIPAICKQNQGCQVVIKTDRHLSVTTGVHNFVAEKTLEIKITPQQELVIGDLYPAYAAIKLGQDEIINAFDMAYLLTQWEKSGKADLNNDGKVNVFDLKILAGNVGKKGLLYGASINRPMPSGQPTD